MKFNKIIVLSLNIQIIILIFYSLNSKKKVVLSRKISKINEVLNEPLILIGGYMSSGTSLVRSILDVHPKCKCGPEIKITYESLKFIENFNETTISGSRLEKAMALFAYFTYLTNVNNTYHICNKEPGNYRFIKYFKRVFPKSKFILVVRDGREVAYSWSRRNKLKNTFEKFLSLLKTWNKFNKKAFKECIETGSDYCKIIYYNKLVTNPKEEIGQMASFLNLEWTDKFLEHEKYLGKDIKLAKHEYSLYGLKKEINSDSLNNWIGKISDYNEEIVSKEIDMLRTYKFIS